MSFLLFALSLVQTQAPSTAARAADKFALDLPADETVTAPAEPAAQPLVEPAAAAGGYTLDTPIADLIADPRAKAVLDADVPGLSEDENLPKFKALSLRKLAPLSGGQMTTKLLAKVEADLAAIEGAPPPVKKVESRRALPSGR
jgi:hypothetical protein